MVEAFPDKRYRAVLRQVIPTADRTSATVMVKVTILDKDPNLKPEMSARDDVPRASRGCAAGGTRRRTVVLVPATAVVTRDGTPLVFEVTEDNTVRAGASSPALAQAGQIVVKEGLNGQRSAGPAPAEGLGDGAAVRIEAADPPESHHDGDPCGRASREHRARRRQGRPWHRRRRPQDVRKIYTRDSQQIVVLDGIDLDSARGGVPRPDGPVGLGQDHAAQPDRGHRPADRGQVIVAGTDVAALSESALAGWRSRNVGFIFQFYNLIPVLNGARERGTAAAADRPVAAVNAASAR